MRLRKAVDETAKITKTTKKKSKITNITNFVRPCMKNDEEM